MTLKWSSVKYGNGASWDLLVMDDVQDYVILARLGTLYSYKSGYKLYVSGSCKHDLPADLTIDEAKDAAKLILVAGRQS